MEVETKCAMSKRYDKHLHALNAVCPSSSNLCSQIGGPVMVLMAVAPWHDSVDDRVDSDNVEKS